MLVTDLEFVLAPFFAGYFGIDVTTEAPQDSGVATFLDLPIAPGTLLFVRGAA